MNELQLYSELAPLATKSKVEIIELAQKQIDYIKENGDAENTFAFLKKCSTLLDLVTDGVKEDAMTAIGRGSDYFHGVKMTVESRTTYSYSNDPIWKSLQKQTKERESLLKAIKEPIEVLDPESGEVVTVYPATKKVSDYIKTNF